VRTPRQYHQKRHDGDYETCESCAKGLRDCQRKITFQTVDDARAAVLDFNANHNYHQSLYCCRYCLLYHTKTNHGRTAPKPPFKKWSGWSRSRKNVVTRTFPGNLVS